MKQYKEMLSTIMYEGLEIPPARENMPSVEFYPSISSRYKFENGFPIITGKAMPFYSILGELVGFMKGLTDVREYNKLGCKVWWQNAYKWNIVDNPNMHNVSEDLYVKGVFENGDKIPDINYDLGRIYAAQWRDWFGMTNHPMYGYVINRTDQLVNMINSILDTPYSRYHVMTAWNPSEMNKDTVSQPNCHVYFQASCVPNSPKLKLHLRETLSQFLTDDTIDELLDNGYNPDKLLYTHLTQRSCDMFLGVPFNITSYSLFTILLGIFTNSLPVEFVWNGVNCHVYHNHSDQVRDYVNGEIYELPKLSIKGIKSLEDVESKLNTLSDLKNHFSIEGYKRGSKIPAPLSVGL